MKMNIYRWDYQHDNNLGCCNCVRKFGLRTGGAASRNEGTKRLNQACDAPKNRRDSPIKFLS